LENGIDDAENYDIKYNVDEQGTVLAKC